MPIFISDDGQVSIVKEIIEKTMPLETFLESFQERNVSLPFLPRGCRSFISKGNLACLVIEVSPGIKQLNYTTEDEGNFNFNLYMPWAYYAITVSLSPLKVRNVCVAWSYKKVSSEKDSMFAMGFPNILHGVMCLGGVKVKDNPIHLAIDELMDKILTGKYCSDYFEGYVNQYNVPIEFAPDEVEAVEYFLNWESKSEKATDKEMINLWKNFSNKSVDTRSYQNFLDGFTVNNEL